MNDDQKIETGDEGPPHPFAGAKTKNPVAACGCLGCLGIVACVALFFAALALGGFALGIADAKKGFESGSWPTTEGKILSSEIETHRSTSQDAWTDRTRTTISYHGVVTYEYQVAGRTYQSDRISYKSYGGSRENAEKVLISYPVGKRVTVHYNPGIPAESVLETGVGWATFLGPFLWVSPFVLLILVVGGMIIRARKKKAAVT